MYFLETINCFSNIKVVLYSHKENKNKTLIHNQLYQILKNNYIWYEVNKNRGLIKGEIMYENIIKRQNDSINYTSLCKIL
jgi:hypothetical protein